jgi:hypothetical protein
MLSQITGAEPHQVKHADNDQQGDEDAAQRAPDAQGKQVLHSSRRCRCCEQSVLCQGISSNHGVGGSSSTTILQRYAAGSVRGGTLWRPAHWWQFWKQEAGTAYLQRAPQRLAAQPHQHRSYRVGCSRRSVPAPARRSCSTRPGTCESTPLTGQFMNERQQESKQGYSHRESSAAHLPRTAGSPASPSTPSECAPPA